MIVSAIPGFNRDIVYVKFIIQIKYDLRVRRNSINIYQKTNSIIYIYIYTYIYIYIYTYIYNDGIVLAVPIQNRMELVFTLHMGHKTVRHGVL